MMNSVILCEGEADLILTSYYLQHTLNFHYINKENPTLRRFNISKITYEWYEDEDENKLMIAEVNGNNFSKSLERIFDYNSKCDVDEVFSRICVITDNDDASAYKRIFQLQEMCDKFSNSKLHLAPACWNNVSITTGFEEKKNIALLFLLQPIEEFGNIETFILKAFSEKCDEDKNVVVKAKEYIRNIESNTYLRDRGSKNKAELSAFFSVVSPRRTFAKIDQLLKEIEWNDYDSYNAQFSLLKYMNKSVPS